MGASLLALAKSIYHYYYYLNLINEMSGNYRCVKFVNLSMLSLIHI